MNKGKTYLLPASLRRSIIEYLSTKPYSEVVDGIKALESLREVADNPSELMRSQE